MNMHNIHSSWLERATYYIKLAHLRRKKLQIIAGGGSITKITIYLCYMYFKKYSTGATYIRLADSDSRTGFPIRNDNLFNAHLALQSNTNVIILFYFNSYDSLVD